LFKSFSDFFNTLNDQLGQMILPFPFKFYIDLLFEELLSPVFCQPN